MKIDHIEAIHLRYEYPNQHGFESSGGITSARLTSLVLVHTDDGKVGLGSAYSHPALVDIVVRQLDPLLRGSDPREVEALWEAMYGYTRWYGRKGAAMSALGGIDVALWDLRGQAAGKPVWKLLGGQTPSCPAYASSLLWNSIDGLRAEAQRHLSKGFRRMKMRLGRDLDYDVNAPRAVKREIGPRCDLMCDASMRYTVDVAKRVGSELAQIGVFWFEEPFAPENLDAFSALRGTVGVPLAAGENEFGVQGFTELVHRQAVDIVQADASRCGGITEVLRVAELADKAALKLAPHSWSDAIAIFANAQVVAATPHALTVEVDQTGNPFVDELLSEPWKVVDGRLQLSERPGLGIELNPQVVDRLRLADPYHIPDGWYSDMVFGAAWNKPAGPYQAD
ncbi:MAG: mandelate racemase/muconate lactonizing enzyme family protein [Planctomycetota bacterium]|nr:mandelate racemase/muconate lactonizing enzyme family protein [Planctomycetota bacterium]